LARLRTNAVPSFGKTKSCARCEKNAAAVIDFGSEVTSAGRAIVALVASELSYQIQCPRHATHWLIVLQLRRGAQFHTTNMA
jgi:hypothetical protein